MNIFTGKKIFSNDTTMHCLVQKESQPRGDNLRLPTYAYITSTAPPLIGMLALSIFPNDTTASCAQINMYVATIKTGQKKWKSIIICGFLTRLLFDIEKNQIQNKTYSIQYVQKRLGHKLKIKSF